MLFAILMNFYFEDKTPPHSNLWMPQHSYLFLETIDQLKEFPNTISSKDDPIESRYHEKVEFDNKRGCLQRD